ncbi:MAG TPA: DinB family protein [Ktedonosporobacter sp.]|nr:DinB family protein [Ktedonosporobacter sp.]
MTTSPFKIIVLDLLQQGHQDEEAFLQGLTETERTAIGTPELWSSKDHIAHKIYWRRNFIQKLKAILQHQEIRPNEEDEAQLNSMNFEENRLRPWSEIYAESERLYAELITLTEQLSEEELTTSGRFPWISGDRPLYPSFLGNLYEHEQEHLVQYYVDRHNLTQAIQIREKCANTIVQADVPEWIKGWFLYNLACFYSQQNQLEQAAARLQEALTLAPDLTEQSKSDPDLVALRNQLA